MPAPAGNALVAFLRRLAFRVSVAYLIAYSLIEALSQFPLIWHLRSWTNEFERWLVPKVEVGILNLPHPPPFTFNGGGDALFDWVVQGLTLSVGLAAGLLWTFIDRQRRYDRPIWSATWLALRFCLASTMIGYGTAKLIGPTQFPAPGPMRLHEMLGHMSPMGILWSFMGASRAYTAIAGIFECLGGVLLLFRRTALLGAAVAIGVMTNVVLLNLCYDVPVKLFPANLLLIAIAVLSPRAVRICRAFLRHETIETLDPLPPRPARWILFTRTCFAVLFMGAIASSQIFRLRVLAGPERVIVPAAESLRGWWEVVHFFRDGKEVEPLLTDNSRWHEVDVTNGYLGDYVLFAFGPNYPMGSWSISPGSLPDKFLLGHEGKAGTPKAFIIATVHRPDADHLEIEGRFAGKVVRIEMHRESPESWLLMSRGFHWVNEAPFNR